MRLVLCQLTHFSASHSSWSIDFHGRSSLVPNLALQFLASDLLITAEPAAGTGIAFPLPTPSPQAIWSATKRGRDCPISNDVTAVFRALIIEKPNAARAELSCVRRDVFTLCHRGHPSRVSLSGKPGAVHSAKADLGLRGTYLCLIGQV